MCAYANTDNKAAIRRQWDLPMLEQWHRTAGRPLSYFGLTGPELHDLRDWNHVLGQRTSVESRGRTRAERREADEKMAKLLLNLSLYDLDDRPFQLLRGDMEDILLDGIDADRARPVLHDGGPAHQTRFRYDVVNLDFDGGAGYHDQHGKVKRIDALKKLFERQEGYSFVLFLTVNVRSTLGLELEEYIRGLQGRAIGQPWERAVNWHLKHSSLPEQYPLKAVIPSLVRAAAELRMFRVTCRPPVFYVGYREARMVHFAFELHAQRGNLRTFSTQQDKDLIALPLLESVQGQLRLTQLQCPGLEPSRCAQSLNFLPEALSRAILASRLSEVALG